MNPAVHWGEFQVCCCALGVPVIELRRYVYVHSLELWIDEFGGVWFSDETQDCVGPYGSVAQARTARRVYVDQVLGPASDRRAEGSNNERGITV